MKWKRRKKETENEKVLKFGLQFCYCIRKSKTSTASTLNFFMEIDGQVTQKYNGVLIIKDKRSPYNGMSVDDYRKFCKEWDTLLEKKDKALLKQLQAEAAEKGIAIPTSLGIQTLQRVNRADLPPFPHWADNHLENEEKFEPSHTKSE